MGIPSCARAIAFAFLAVIPSLLRAGATFETQTPLLGSLRPLPPYATAYAPLIHLYSGEDSFPSDIAVHLAHTIPEVRLLRVIESQNSDIRKYRYRSRLLRDTQRLRCRL